MGNTVQSWSELVSNSERNLHYENRTRIHFELRPPSDPRLFWQR